MCGKRVKFNCQIRFMRLKFSNWFMYDNISQAKKNRETIAKTSSRLKIAQAELLVSDRKSGEFQRRVSQPLR